MSRYTVTTAIPYVNGKPHVGHALELVETDVLTRHRRQRGDFYRKSYSGLYCVGCELFSRPDGRCLEQGTVPEMVEENNWCCSPPESGCPTPSSCTST